MWVLPRFFLLSAFLLWVTHSVNAQAASPCPDRLAYVENNDLSRQVLLVVKDIYRELGCDTDFVPLPGRRGVVAFNAGQVAGEVMRLPIAERFYTRPYIRSEVPLLTLKSVLWLRPGLEKPPERVGGLMGILWLERFDPAYHLQKFKATEQMIRAYNAGAIDAFIGDNATLSLYLAKDAIREPPVAYRVLRMDTLYHYLGYVYKPYLQDFTQFLLEKKPFEAYQAAMDGPLKKIQASQDPEDNGM